ncbi:MAG: LysR family transcriptional regulator [Oscillospiraceae bacterium]|nr:LysR family transcriptional regulator [Oscillospiraceae bacterium]
MDFTQLKYFKAICTYQTVSAAAEYLHISQPSLSNSIKNLENEFGVSLFVRGHRGMMLTAEGKSFLKMCEDILQRTETAQNIMRDLGTERKKLRLGVPPMIGSLILPELLRGFRLKHPDITLEITEEGRFALQEKLSRGFLDMAFFPHNLPPDSSFWTHKLAELDIVCCTNLEHPLSNEKSLTPKAMKNTPIVLFCDGFYQTEEIKRWFSQSFVNPNLLLQTSQLSTVLTVISHGTAAGFLFRKLINDTSGLCAIPLQNPVSVSVSLVRKKNSYHFEAMKAFTEYIIKNNPFKEKA